MDQGEPSLGRFCLDEGVSGESGIIIEIKTGGWRTMLLESGFRINRRSGSLEYSRHEPTDALVESCETLGVGYRPYTGNKTVLSRRRQALAPAAADTAAPASRSATAAAAAASRRGSGARGGPAPGAPDVGDALALLGDDGRWKRGVVDSVADSIDADADVRLHVDFEDGTRSEEPWPPLAERNLYRASCGRVPASLGKRPRDLVGFRFRRDDGSLGHVVGFVGPDGSKMLVLYDGAEDAAVLLDVSFVRERMVADEETPFARVGRAQLRAAPPLPAKVGAATPPPAEPRAMDTTDDLAAPDHAPDSDSEADRDSVSEAPPAGDGLDPALSNPLLVGTIQA